MILQKRRNSRYPIALDVHYKILRSTSGHVIGIGKTVDISSKVVRFKAQHTVPVGGRVEVCLSWPAQLDKKVALKLVTKGRVIRSAGTIITVKIEKYEFRTRNSARPH